jgi:nucleotide-binding universal stress UspA family protein
MKSILVPIGGSGSDETVFETALAAARPLAAHLRFLHVKIGAAEAARNTPHMDFAVGANLRIALDELETESATRSLSADRHVHDFCDRSMVELCDRPERFDKVTASCREEGGDALGRIIFYARHSDLVVVGRPSRPNGLPPDFLDLLILGCGRPVLIAGPRPVQSVTGTIMACWRESADAARALAAAAPLLAHAQRVVLTGVAETDDATAIHDVAGQLAWSGIVAEVQFIKPDGSPVEAMLASAARACAADLVVMGAYGHSRLREAVFGGCTRSFIRGADRPILLTH